MVNVDFDGKVPDRRKPPKRVGGDFGGESHVPARSKPPKIDDSSLLLNLPFGKLMFL